MLIGKVSAAVAVKKWAYVGVVEVQQSLLIRHHKRASFQHSSPLASRSLEVLGGSA